MARIFAMVAALALLVGCANQNSIKESGREDLGAFSLGHNIVVASKMQKVPISRDATQEEWVDSLTSALAERFERYEGSQLYHFGISVEGFALAPPGVPLVATPKSAVVINVTVWDDAEGAKLNEDPHQLLVFESFGEGLIVGSGFTNTREEQLENLSFNAARQVEVWLRKQHRELGWFAAKDGPAPDAEDAPVTAEPAPATDTDPAASPRLEDSAVNTQLLLEPVTSVDEALTSE